MCEINTRCDPLPPRFSDSSHYFHYYCTRRQWTVPDSIKNMAFADRNEDNISSLLRSKNSKSTQRSVARSIKLFKDYLLQKKDESVDFETFSKEKLDEMLRMFYASVKKKGILMFITCIMIRLFHNQQKLAKTQNNHTNNVVTTNKINM